ncbi:MAG: DNA replication complex GINS family protein [Candidatus Aenigmarchaeota archaeon]|nr:DNA replication complex GINS family protein [Candidatus Aenigmarchaeota archaeon]
MPEETITFELIRKIQREEQRLPKLARLPESFFNAVASYLESKRRVVEGDDRKGFLEIKNVERLVEDIRDRRERKILNAAIMNTRTKVSPENLTEEEKGFYNSLVALIKDRRDSILQPVVATNKEELKIVVFKEDVPEFLGSDMKTYGPFKKGDTARLPEDNIKVLMEKGAIE